MGGGSSRVGRRWRGGRFGLRLGNLLPACRWEIVARRVVWLVPGIDRRRCKTAALAAQLIQEETLDSRILGAICGGWW